MDFLSALFSAIGDTFKAGASVNIAQISERNAKRQIEFGKQQLEAQAASDRLAWLTLDSKATGNMITLAIVLMVIGVIVLLVLNHKKK